MGMFFGHNKPFVSSGLLYSGYAIKHALFTPVGWRVPTKSDFDQLLAYLGGSGLAGGKMKCMGYFHWMSPNTGANNNSGMNMPGSGGRLANFYGKKYFTFLVANTEYKYITGDPLDIQPLYYELKHDNAQCNLRVFNDPTDGMRGGYSVRLIKIDSVNPGTLVDYDGNTYGTVNLNSQIWTTRNWRCTHLRDGAPMTEVKSNSAWLSLNYPAYCAYNNDWRNV